MTRLELSKLSRLLFQPVVVVNLLLKIIHKLFCKFWMLFLQTSLRQLTLLSLILYWLFITHQCEYVYLQPYRYSGSFQVTIISLHCIIKITTYLVLGTVFEVGGLNGAIAGWIKFKIKMVAGAGLEKARFFRKSF